MATGAPAAEASTVARRNPVSQSAIRLYAVPVVLFTLGLFFQLVVLPSSFTTSHYEVLGLVESASVDEVVSGYEKLSSKWSAGLDIPMAANFIKIRYAFELLTNPLLKRDYDIFGVDEQLHIIETVKKQYDGKQFAQVPIPLLNVSFSDSMEKAEGKLTSEDFFSSVGKNETWLIQAYSAGSHRCANFSKAWKRISSLLDGVANTGIVELGEVEFASFLAERRSTGQPFFRHGLPALVAFSPNCRSSRCYTRYDGDLSVDAIVDWIATSILGLPRILYYSRETLVQNFIAKSGQHKNKIIFFSKTGERAAPSLRQTAKDYSAYAAFAFVLWKEEESSVWWNMLEVESAPAIVVLKDPGVKPMVYHGSFHRSWFANIMEENKHQDLPQLRSITSMELGCDAMGHSRAGNSTLAWYCVVVAGRPSFQLNIMRETLRSVRKILMNDTEPDFAHENALQFPLSAANALKESRLTFAWLDGETQSKYCFFYLYLENSYETCGPRRHGDPIDVPKLFIVRYRRNSTENSLKPTKKVKSIWNRFEDEDVNLASQLVARYNGSDNLYEVIKWISQIIDDGDNRNLPYFRARTPELVPEDNDPTWPNAWHTISRGWGLKTKLQDIIQNVYSHTADPRLGPLFMLGACISFSTIWLRNGAGTRQTEDEDDTMVRRHYAAAMQAEPADARQILSTDSDSE